MRLSQVFEKKPSSKHSGNTLKATKGVSQNTAASARAKKTNKKKNARTIKIYAGYIRIAAMTLIMITLTIIWLLGYPQQLYENAIQKTHDILTTVGFKVEEVKVLGRVNTQQQDLLKSLGVNLNESILAIDLQQARFRLEKLEWVRKATVIRRLPNRILIKIEERSPIAIWQRNNQFYLVDADGTAILTKDHRHYGVLPLIVGEGAPQKSPELLESLKSYPNIQKNLQAISRVRARRWNLYLVGGILVKLSDASLNAGLETLENLLNEQRLSVSNVKEVDLRTPDRYFIKVTPETIKNIKSSRKGKFA